MEKLRIDPEFRDKIPPLTDVEFEQLRENIISDGEVYEPIVAWNGTIVDGHNRYKIVQEHPEIQFRVKEMDFADKWAAFDWMYKKQLGRRNLTDEQRTMLIGKMLAARKQSIGNHAERNESGKYQKRQNDAQGGKTSIQIATELGIGQKTVERAEQFAKGVEAIREKSPEAAEKILKGGSGVTKAAIQNVPKMDLEQVKELARAIEKGPKETKKVIQEQKPAMRMEDFNATPLNPEPYNAMDFLEQIKDFPNQVDSVFRCFLELHGDLLADNTCKTAFRKVLMESKEIIDRYFVEVTNK